MKLSLIVAMAENGVIGRDGALPWHLPADLRRFKTLTMGHSMVMGRKTFESIGRVLPGRRSIVVSRDPEWRAEGAWTAPSLEAALALTATEAEVFVIGGAEIFRQALPRADRLYLTRVLAEVEGDVYFPELDASEWRLVSREEIAADEKNLYPTSFEILECEVVRCGTVEARALAALLESYGLELVWIEDDAAIPGSYWGPPEAGLVGARVYARRDTPVHSLLHEACHAICMGADRRRSLDTDAGGDPLEENAVCYLQILLADRLPGVGAERLMIDMDRWGYSFRLGSARAWFENDAEDARAWLEARGLLPATAG